MKFFIINSFRTMVYVAYIAVIVAGIGLGIYNAGAWSGEVLKMSGTMAQIVDFLLFSFAGWVVASLICGLIVTLLDI
ncbi:MAG: hypothetical protein MRY64_12920, partial [Hyphomonadaceae bacterium]|nr:hypothetical protein [Hyphomonadaceae bacterium]